MRCKTVDETSFSFYVIVIKNHLEVQSCNHVSAKFNIVVAQGTYLFEKFLPLCVL